MTPGRDGGDCAGARPPGAADDAGEQAPVSVYLGAVDGRDHALLARHRN
jgi:hypothetical protein